MKILQSKIYDGFNRILAFVWDKTERIKQSSFILSKIDVLILFFILLTIIVSSFGTTNQIGAVSLFVPVLVLIKMLITKGEKAELELPNFFILVYLLICFITNLTSSLPVQSFYGYMKTFVYICFYFSVCQFLKSNKKYVKIILLATALVVSAESVIGLIQNSAGVENISTWQDTSYVNPEDVLTRVYGTLKPYNPNLLAGFLTAGLPSLIALTVLSLKNKKNIIGIIFGILTLTSAFAIFLTGCRGTYISLLVTVLIVAGASHYLIFKTDFDEKSKKVWNISAAAFSAFTVLFMILNHGILKRLMSIFILRGDSSTAFRMNVYHSAIQMFQDNFICGIGVGNKVFREIYGLYMLSGYDALSCYCVFLEMAVESGIFSLLAYLSFTVILIREGIKTFKSDNIFENRIIIMTAIISISAVLVHGFVDTIYFRPQVQYLFWTMAAIILTYANNKDNSENENTRISS